MSLATKRELDMLAGLKILVVEDTLLVAESICDILEHVGCVVVGPAARADSALALTREAELDGAVLDVNLAGERSFSVAAALDALQVPYVFVTGYDDVDALSHAYRQAPRLNKPFHGRSLIEALGQLVARA